MKKPIGLEPVELNDAELAAVAGGNPFQNAYIYQSADNSYDVNQVNFGADNNSVNNSYISIS